MYPSKVNGQAFNHRELMLQLNEDIKGIEFKNQEIMSANNFTLIILVDKSPEEVFNVVKNVRLWWSGLFGEEFNGDSEKLLEEFSFRAGDGMHYSKQKLIELEANKKIAWLVTESKLNFLKKTDEWTCSKLIFELEQQGNKTQVTFTHQGLTPEIECFDSCAPAWTMYIQQKLLPLLSADKVPAKS